MTPHDTRRHGETLDSVYFAVPTGRQPQAVLQATFEPRYRPKAEEFEVLKHAAALAADVLRIEEMAGDSLRRERSA